MGLQNKHKNEISMPIRIYTSNPHLFIDLFDEKNNEIQIADESRLYLEKIRECKDIETETIFYFSLILTSTFAIDLVANWLYDRLKKEKGETKLVIDEEEITELDGEKIKKVIKCRLEFNK